MGCYWPEVFRFRLREHYMALLSLKMELTQAVFLKSAILEISTWTPVSRQSALVIHFMDRLFTCANSYKTIILVKNVL